jgi:hypothetical protein
MANSQTFLVVLTERRLTTPACRRGTISLTKAPTPSVALLPRLPAPQYLQPDHRARCRECSLRPYLRQVAATTERQSGKARNRQTSPSQFAFDDWFSTTPNIDNNTCSAYAREAHLSQILACDYGVNVSDSGQEANPFVLMDRFGMSRPTQTASANPIQATCSFRILQKLYVSCDQTKGH